jgi:hypothetical protein
VKAHADNIFNNEIDKLAKNSYQSMNTYHINNDVVIYHDIVLWHQEIITKALIRSV